jgi:hypothetical protein
VKIVIIANHSVLKILINGWSNWLKFNYYGTKQMVTTLFSRQMMMYITDNRIYDTQSTVHHYVVVKIEINSKKLRQ